MNNQLRQLNLKFMYLMYPIAHADNVLVMIPTGSVEHGYGYAVLAYSLPVNMSQCINTTIHTDLWTYYCETTRDYVTRTQTK